MQCKLPGLINSSIIILVNELFWAALKIGTHVCSSFVLHLEFCRFINSLLLLSTNLLIDEYSTEYTRLY